MQLKHFPSFKAKVEKHCWQVTGPSDGVFFDFEHFPQLATLEEHG
jgi:hypothetical protein